MVKIFPWFWCGFEGEYSDIHFGSFWCVKVNHSHSTVVSKIHCFKGSFLSSKLGEEREDPILR